MKLIILSILILTIFTIKDDPRLWKSSDSDEEPTPINQNQYWFNNVVDHFNYQQTQLWKQRYWVYDQYFNPNVGPVFLYICGEYTCSGVPQERQWVVTLANRLQGLILVVEHRYYGQSLPFGNDSLSLENLKYLNSEQALSDLAFFIGQMKANKMYKISDKNQWITVGGSYPGALSAWFRYKYPHLTVGALASSAVILAIQDYKDFDEQMYSSSVLSGDYCSNAINDSNSKIQEILNSSEGDAFKASFKGGQKLTDDEFLFFWIDSIVGQIQYGKRTNLCNSIKGKSAEEQFKYFQQLARQDNEVFEYGSYYLKNQTFAIQAGTGSRSWYFQSCTEYGFWQTPSDRHPLRSSRLSLDFFRKFCADSFGQGTWPKVDRKNVEYGGLSQKSFNLFMVNGVEDPWRWASLQESKGNIISKIANCTNCAHCVDLYTPKSTDAPELKKIRDSEYLEIMSWLGNTVQERAMLRQQ